MGESIKIDWNKKFDSYHKDKNYIVEGIISKKKSKIIFILESPHNDELINKNPVARQSGIDMANFLNISIVPLQPTNNLDKLYKYLVYKLDNVMQNG